MMARTVPQSCPPDVTKRQGALIEWLLITPIRPRAITRSSFEPSAIGAFQLAPAWELASEVEKFAATGPESGPSLEGLQLVPW